MPHKLKSERVAYRKGWTAKNKEKIQARQREWRLSHVEQRRVYALAWRLANPERKRALDKAYHQSHAEQIRDRARAWVEANPERARATKKLWYLANKEAHLAYGKKRRAANPELYRARNKNYHSRPEIKERKRARTKLRYAQDLEFYIKVSLSNRLRGALSRYFGKVQKADRSFALAGCSFVEFKQHIENQFTTDMTWEAVMNGAIHLDHKRPCASFDLTQPEQQKQCFHYTNLQPLWAVDNLRKGAKFQPR